MRAPWTGTRRARLETGCSERLGLPLVRADELGHRQHVPLDRLLQLGLSRAGGEIGLAVEGVEPENVAVAPVPRRRAGAAVAGASGSSAISASDRVSPGMFAHRSGGETSSPSQVYRLGIACAFSKALLSTANSDISR